MPDPYHPFSDAVALADLPVPRSGSSVLLFIDPEGLTSLARDSGRPPDTRPPRNPPPVKRPPPPPPPPKTK